MVFLSAYIPKNRDGAEKLSNQPRGKLLNLKEKKSFLS